LARHRRRATLPRVSQTKSGHVVANAVLLLLVAAGGLLMIGSALLNVILMALGVGAPMPEPVDDFTMGQYVGRIAGLGWCVVGGAIAFVWCGIAAWRLLGGHPKARKTAIAAWVATLPACCCFPLAGYGIWSLTRPVVRDELDR
jgi:hypothetical protein